MRFGYNQPLCLWPFDHRVSYVTGMFHFDPPLTADQRQATDSKEVIYEGFRQAVGLGVAAASAGVLVDEEFGGDILRDAAANGYVTVLGRIPRGAPYRASDRRAARC